MRAASQSLGLGCEKLAFAALIAFAFLGCAGGNAAVIGGTIDDDAGVTPPAVDAGTHDAGATDAGADAASATADEAEPPAVDPAVAHALLAKTGEAPGAAPLGLRFEIIELGSELPWGFAVVNRGTEAAVVDFDARLLTLEIVPPPDPKAKANAKPPKPISCRLPADVIPSSVDPALALKLEPGEGLVQNFDPRLYCLGKSPAPLVEGAVVSPRFGWTRKMKVSWHNGKREETPAVQSEPFVAEPSEAQGSLPTNGGDATERRLKELSGTPFTLGSDFATGAGSATAAKEALLDPSGLVLSISGSDAADEGAAVATATFSNRGKKKQELYFRRELITYAVSGPDGEFQCAPEPDLRSPDRSAFQTLAPGGKISAVSRLIEMCPAHTFARPGLYLVHARFDAADDGADYGLHAFMGRLVSQKPALVRVRAGELPFTPSTGTERVRVGQ
jgi:hypothetical protein